MKEMETIVKKIIHYLDTAKPGDPRNAKLVKALAQFDPGMAKAYATREVKVRSAMEKIRKARKEHRENQMVILYKKYVDEAAELKEEQRRQLLQQLKDLEQDILDALSSDKEGVEQEAEQETEQERADWLKKIENEWEIWTDKDEFLDGSDEGKAKEDKRTAEGQTELEKEKDKRKDKENDNKDKQTQLYMDVKALHESLKTASGADDLRAKLMELKQYMDDVLQEHKSGNAGKDKLLQTAVYYDKQKEVIEELRKYLEKGISAETQKAIELLENMEKLCVSEEAAVVCGMRESLRPVLEEMLQREDELRLDPQTSPEEYARSVARSAQMIRNLNGKLWSPMGEESLTGFCDRVRGYADAESYRTSENIEAESVEPEKTMQDGQAAQERPDQSTTTQKTRVQKISNAKLKEEIVRRSDSNDPYVEADDMKQYDIKARKREIKAEITMLRRRFFPEQEQPQKEAEILGKASRKDEMQKTGRRKQSVQRQNEQDAIDQGWNIV